ncbi:B-cell receptor CD22 isoform X3 [Phyllostomus hastatus]|uniref:B-cell receptor CD22 isoform X3 n=1 Tax=Phyllostomus hastatus TaxID=9423 RepID=UPI001E67F29D|nr:B-cell receptor CD22 isoform X3 [Phyllostomus hastatus]
MHLLSPLLLLLEYVAFSDSQDWKFEHPTTLYAWEGTCIWIPCRYTIPGNGKVLDNLTVYQNYKWDDKTKDFSGTVLHEEKKFETPAFEGRVRFLGDNKSNCTLHIHPVNAQDNGQLGLRVTSRNDRWMDKIVLNISKTAPPPRINLPSEIRELQEVKLTCQLDFACFGSQIKLQWSLEGTQHNLSSVTSTSLTTKTVSTQSQLTFQPEWTNHGKKLTCQLWNDSADGLLSQETVQLDVKHSPKEVTMVIQNPSPIREGDDVTLFCNYTSSNPSVTRYEWQTQGSWKEIMPGVLVIQKVPWNASPFSCAACNQWCSWASPVNLHVQYAPRGVKVLLISPGSEIYSGHPVLLRCNFSSSYPTDVLFFWKKNGIFLKEGRDLSFDSISPEDAGNYNCLVNNSIGQSTSEAWKLQVLYAPRRLRVSISPKDSVMEGKKAVLTCESDANPPISRYTWFDWNNQNLHHDDQTLRLDPVKVQDSGAYWCQGANRLGMDQSPPRILTVYYSPETISKQVALGMGLFLAILLLPLLGVKLQRSWKRIQSQQGLQENSSAQSFFVRNRKVRRAPLSEGPHSLGCYNPVMEDSISYATLRFPLAETDTPRIGEAGTSEVQRTSLNRDNTVTYSVVQKRQVGDYENVTPDVPEDEGIHYSELVHLGIGERPLSQEGVEYVTLKH